MTEKDDHHQKTVGLFTTLGLLPQVEDLNQPHKKASGVQGVSAIYFYKLKNGGRLVVKFDRKDRMEREKGVLKALLLENCGVGCLLNYGGVQDLEHMQDAIVYREATGTGGIKTLDQVLQEALKNRTHHGVNALKMVFNTLEQLHQNNAAPSDQGKVLKWKDLFPKVEMHQETIREDAGLLDLELDELLSSLSQETGDLLMGRIHGDLNHTNAIIATNKALEPSNAYLIDFADSRPNHPIILDAIRLETELWQETAPALVSKDQAPDFMKGFKEVRKQLDSFSPEGPESVTPLLQDLFELTQLIRHRANLYTPLSKQQYLTGLGLSHLHATTFRTVRERPLKLKLALHGAALCQTALGQSPWRPQPLQLSSKPAKTGPSSPFAQTVVEKITLLLGQQHMEPCRVALESCLNSNFPAQDITSAAEEIAGALCDRKLDDNIILLGAEVKNLCDDPLMAAEQSESLWKTAEQILGWLVLLGVDEAWADSQDLSKLKKGEFQIPAKTAEEAAIAVQRLHQKPGVRLPPETGPTLGWTLEAGIEPINRVRQIKELIWTHYMPTKPAPPFMTPADNAKLGLIFLDQAAKKEPGLVIDLSDKQHPINCDDIKKELNEIPNFHVIYFNSPEKTCMVLPEGCLILAVELFLRNRPNGKT